VQFGTDSGGSAEFGTDAQGFAEFRDTSGGAEIDERGVLLQATNDPREWHQVPEWFVS
jgi:hypothetical protein